jgi:hypothetical protein
VLFTVAGLAGIAVSITGNETAQRWGRGRVVTVAMSTAAILSLLTGWSASAPAVLAALLVVLWNAAIYFESSALTAGTVEAADKELRGATMGLHSMCGYAGGFIGPLGVGLVLDFVGGSQSWGVAFGHLALITLTGLFFLRRLGARSAAQTVGCQLCLARSPLPDVPGQENGGSGAGQTSEPAGAEAQRPGGELRRPAELVKRDAEQERPEEPRAKADAGIEPDRCPSVPRGGNGEHAGSEIRKVALHDETDSHGKT